MKTIIRYSIGPTTNAGIDCFHRSVESVRRIYKDVEIFVLINDPHTNLRIKSKGLNIINQGRFRDSLSIKPRAGFNVHWKLYPPRLDPSSYEIFIDNDIVLNKEIDEVSRFLSATDSSFLVYEGLHRSFGSFDRFVPQGWRLNSGIFGLPPGYDFGGEIELLFKKLQFIAWSNDYFDEQGVVASVMSNKNYNMIPLSKVPIIESDWDMLVHEQNEGLCGWHFVGINRYHHNSYSEYFCDENSSSIS